MMTCRLGAPNSDAGKDASIFFCSSTCQSKSESPRELFKEESMPFERFHAAWEDDAENIHFIAGGYLTWFDNLIDLLGIREKPTETDFYADTRRVTKGRADPAPPNAVVCNR